MLNFRNWVPFMSPPVWKSHYHPLRNRDRLQWKILRSNLPFHSSSLYCVKHNINQSSLFFVSYNFGPCHNVMAIWMDSEDFDQLAHLCRLNQDLTVHIKKVVFLADHIRCTQNIFWISRSAGWSVVALLDSFSCRSSFTK